MIDQLLADAIDKKMDLLFEYMLNERDIIRAQAISLMRTHLHRKKGISLNRKNIRRCLSRDYLDIESIFPDFNQKTGVLCAAASYGFVEFMDWAIKRGYKLTSFVMYRAIRPGNDRMVRYLLDKKCLVPPSGYKTAACCGAQSIIRLFYEVGGYPLTLDLFKEAARKLSPDCLEWLNARKCPCDSTVYEKASEENKKWLIKNGV